MSVNLFVYTSPLTFQKKLQGYKDGYDWYIRDTKDAVAAAAASVHSTPIRLYLIYQHGKAPLPERFVREMLARLQNEVVVELRCLDSFLNTDKEAEGDGSDLERLSMCLQNKK